MKLLYILLLCSCSVLADSTGFFITVGGINGEKDGHKLEGQFGTIYKTKDLKMNSNRRIKKGKFCEKGQTKDGLTAVINKLLTEKNGKKKYTLGNKLGKKNKLVNIYEYEDEDIVFYPTNESGEKLKKSKVTISTLQLCIEIELIFRYYNYKKKDDKIWFLSEL